MGDDTASITVNEFTDLLVRETRDRLWDFLFGVLAGGVIGITIGAIYL